MATVFTRLLAGSTAALLSTAAMSVPAQAQTQVIIPEDPCGINYFAAQDMWEISWGSPYYSQRYLFDSSSYGGLVDINGQGIPGYMQSYIGVDPGWRWLYVTREQLNLPGGVRVDYRFEDGTTWRAEVVPDANGCPAATWTPNAPADELDPDPTPGGSGSLGSIFGSAQSSAVEEDETSGAVAAAVVG